MGVEAVTALAFLVLLFRIGFVLGSNPIGELTRELVYLRAVEFRWPAFLFFGALMLETVEFMFPLVVRLGVTAAPDFFFYMNAVQAAIILVATALGFVIMQRYTHVGLDRRIRRAMNMLVHLADQRRRRQRMRGERGAPAAEEERHGKRFE